MHCRITVRGGKAVISLPREIGPLEHVRFLFVGVNSCKLIEANTADSYTVTARGNRMDIAKTIRSWPDGYHKAKATKAEDGTITVRFAKGEK